MKWLFRRKLNWFDCIYMFIVTILMVKVNVLFGLLYLPLTMISRYYEKKYKIHF